MSLSLESFLSLVLPTGIVSAILTHGFALWREREKNRKETERSGRYAALRLATLLEAFAVECAKHIQRVRLHTSIPDAITEPVNELPKLLPYPDDIDWASLSVELASAVLSLPNEVNIGNDHISAYVTVLNMTDNDCGYWEECSLQCGVLGFQSWNLATQLREHCGLKYKPRLRVDWDFLGELVEQRDKYKEKNPDGAY